MVLLSLCSLGAMSSIAGWAPAGPTVRTGRSCKIKIHKKKTRASKMFTGRRANEQQNCFCPLLEKNCEVPLCSWGPGPKPCEEAIHNHGKQNKHGDRLGNQSTAAIGPPSARKYKRVRSTSPYWSESPHAVIKIYLPLL